MKRILIILLAAFCCLAGMAKEPKHPESYNYQRGCELIGNNQLDEGIEYLDNELKQNTKNGYAYAWLASAYARKKELGTATYLSEQALKYLPKSDKYYRAWTYSLRARICLNMNDTAGAIAEYTKAIKEEPKNEDWYEMRGLIYSDMQQWDLSDADFKTYASLTPGLNLGIWYLGHNCYERGMYEEALKLYTQAHLMAQRSWTFSEMAKCEVKLGKYEESAEHIVRALKMESFEETALDVLTSCRNQDFVDAIKAKLRVQIAANPNVPDWQIYMCILHRYLREYEETIFIAQQVRKIYPSMTIDFMLERTYGRMGDWERALQYVNMAIATDSTDVDFLQDRATIYNEMDSVEQMFADLNKLVEGNPEEAEYYFLRGQFNMFYGHYSHAIDDYTMGLAIDAYYGYGWYMRGRCYAAIGEDAKARKDYLRAEELGKDMEATMMAKAMLGKREEAMLLADSLLRADTVDYEYRYNVACVYALLGERELAFRYLEEELQDGFIRFKHLQHDPDFQSLHGEEWDNLLAKYRRIAADRIARFRATDKEEKTEEEGRIVEIPFTPVRNGLMKVDCTINGLPLNFIFDTGASDVTISQTEANFMFKNGYLTNKDIVGKETFRTADGNVHEGTVCVLNNINFGGLCLTGILASVVANQKAPLLLGQTVLQRLGRIEIDNEKCLLRITTR